MGKQGHNVNDNVAKAKKNNVNDNVVESVVRKMVVDDISEYKLIKIQQFLFNYGGYDDCKSSINLAIKNLDKFVYVWYTELDEATRGAIAGMYLEYDGDGRSRPYKEYTDSPIWKYTSSLFKFMRNYTCEKCEKQFNPTHLVVHHKSYNHLGSEIQHPEDMQLLCTDCHLETHGIRRTK